MKKLSVILVISVFINCKSITKEEYLINSCACINNIEVNNKETLKNEIADCLSENFVTYSKMANKEIKTLLDHNPKITRKEAQNKLIETLHNDLMENCPTYKKANE